MVRSDHVMRADPRPLWVKSYKDVEGKNMIREMLFALGGPAAIADRIRKGGAELGGLLKAQKTAAVHIVSRAANPDAAYLFAQGLALSLEVAEELGKVVALSHARGGEHVAG